MNFTIECEIDIPKKVGKQQPVEKVKKGRIPRISKLMALAIHFDQLIKNGDVTDYADIARLGYVSRARLTQIMNLNLLAPDIQEKLLFLPDVKNGCDPITEHQIREIGSRPDWVEQRKLGGELKAKLGLE